MTPDEYAAHVQRIVATAPRLTDTQRAALAAVILTTDTTPPVAGGQG